MKPGSQNARILEVLADGHPHSAGFSRLNSRVSELRAAGYPILPCERTGEGTGPDSFLYRMLVEPEQLALEVA